MNPKTEFPREGSRLGDYELLSTLGQGGMAAVFKAKHVELGALRAIKLLLAGDKDEHRQRFAREARVLAKTRHPGVVRIHAVESEGRYTYLVLDLIEGQDLRARLEAGPASIADVTQLGEAIAEALAHVHELGLVHRDLKPANILLRRSGEPVLTDFGVARDVDEDRLTASGALLGTPNYMAPEQVDPRIGDVSAKTDVFALGSVLHELICGAPVFAGASLPEVVARITQGEIPPPSRSRRGVPRGLDRIVLGCLERDPDIRPDASEVALALKKLSAGDPDPMATPSGWRKLVRRAARREAGPLALVGALVGSAALALTLFLANRLWLEPRREAARLWQAHQAWVVQVLEPRELAYAADQPAPDLDREELERLQATLAKTSHLLRPQASQAASGASGDLLAHLRLLSHLAGERTAVPDRSPGSPSETLVDALILIRDDQREEAWRLLRRVVTLPGAKACRLLDIRLSAEVAPESFPGKVAALSPHEPAFSEAQALGEQVLARLAASCADRALDDPSATPEGLASELAKLNRAAARLSVDPAALADVRRSRLEARSEAWRARLLAAARRGEEVPLLQRLVSVVKARPWLTPGPDLSASLVALLNTLVDDFDATRLGSSTPATAKTIGRLFEAHRLVQRARPGAPTPDRVREVAFAVLHSGHKLSPETVMGCLRIGAMRSSRSLANQAEPGGVEAYLRRHPDSQAAMFCQVLHSLNGAKNTAQRRRALLERLERVRTTRSQELAPSYQGEIDVFSSRLTLAELLDEAVEHSPAEESALVERIYVQTQRARELLDLPTRIVETYETETEAAGLLGDDQRIARSWAEAVELFRARGGHNFYGDFFLGRSLSRYGLALAKLDRLDEAERHCREGLRIVAGSPRHHGHVRAALAFVLRRQARLDDAEQVLLPHLEENLGDHVFVAELATVLIERGERTRAEQIFSDASALLGPDGLPSWEEIEQGISDGR